MAIPTVDQLLQPTLDALHALGGTAAIPAITDHVLAALQLPPEEAAERDPRHNMTKVEYRLVWARTYLKKYGLAEDVQRGVWALTDKGRATPQIDPKAVVAYINLLKKQARVEAGEMPVGELAEMQVDLLEAAIAAAVQHDGQAPVQLQKGRAQHAQAARGHGVQGGGVG